jgi:hypothetical protein
MTKQILSIAFAAVLCTTACSQKKENTTAVNKTETAVKDSAAEAEAKKKAAAAEKAKLPKPYHPEDNATKKIAELVKKFFFFAVFGKKIRCKRFFAL